MIAGKPCETRKAAILVEDRYQVLEVWYPYLRLREAGITTVFVGTGRKKEYLSKEGYPAPEELSIGAVSADDFSAVVIPGGYAPDLMRRSRLMVDFVKKMFEDGKIVAAICHGGWLLASAEVVAGKKVTGFIAIKDDLVHAGGEYLDQEVVVDGNLITSRNPYDLPAFCREILNKF